MTYHAILEYSDTHYWWNYEKDSIIAEVLIPFINGQVMLLSQRTDIKSLVNLSSATQLRIFKTENDILAAPGKTIIDQIEKLDPQKHECTEALIQEAKLNLATERFSSLLQKSFTKQKNQVFVIMKFGDKKLDSAYDGVIKPLFKKYGIEIIRVDEIQNSGKISDQILEFIASSKFILADLTGSRPNCYYETGFAHALGKEIILSCNKEDQVHFDLLGYRFIVWETESEYRAELEKRLTSLLS